MAIEIIRLNLIPEGNPPVVHCKQYDNGRVFQIVLYNGKDPYILTTETIELNIRKSDRHIVTADLPFVVGEHCVDVITTEQMCAVAGKNTAEIRIIRDGINIGTLNFFMQIERSPMENGLESDSEINNLARQVHDNVVQELADHGAKETGYDNTESELEATNVQDAIDEVNEKIENIPTIDAYTKEETDNKFATKESLETLSGVVDGKANATDVTNALANKLDKTNPSGSGSLKLGQNTTVTGGNAVGFGTLTRANGVNTLAMGERTTASGNNAVAGGYNSNASGTDAIAMGNNATASGNYSSAFGNYTEASGVNSLAIGQGTKATRRSQFVFGEYNIEDTQGNNTQAKGKFLEIVGNGNNNSSRSNARMLDWYGNETLWGDLIFNKTKSLTNEIQRLDNRINSLPNPVVFQGTLGVGGTITELPVASAENDGYMYKVITEGTYQGIECKVGDALISKSTEWVLIPAGDTDTDTWRNIKVNGTEVLSNGISSGFVDFVGSENIDVEFDNNGNKIGIKTKNIYTKSEVNDIVAEAIYDVLPSEVASGSVATFETDLALPLKSAKFDVNAVQNLNGQSGAYPAGGSAQIWDEQWEVGSIDNSTGLNTNDNNNIRCKNYISVSPSTTYYIKVATGTYIRIYWYDENNTFISSETAYSGVKTSPNNAKFLRLRTTENYGNTYKNDISVNYPSADTAYHPYSNICPISGWSEINRYKLGSNFFNKNAVTSGFLINASGNEVSYADWNLSDYIEVVEGASYYLYGLTTHPNTNQDNFELFDENKNKVGYANVKTNEQPYLIPSGVKYIKCSVKNPDLDTAQLGVSVNSSFVPYNPVIEKTVINLGGTYYGGYVTEDKEGHRQFVVTHSNITDLGSFTWNSSAEGYTQSPVIEGMKKTASGSTIPDMICDTLKVDTPSNVYNKVSDGSISIAITTANSGLRVYHTVLAGLNASQVKSALSGIYIAYPLETPIVIDLPDGTPITTVAGVNNIFCNTGNTEVEYKESTDKYVENKLDETCYTKSEDDTFLNAKADKSTTYTKTEVNSLLNGKAKAPTVITGTLTAGQTSITLQSSAITNNSTIFVYTTDGTEWNTIAATTGQVVITFDAQASDLGVKVEVT